jgi:galactokinase/mevalonate kinase-like predicted kinase
MFALAAWQAGRPLRKRITYRELDRIERIALETGRSAGTQVPVPTTQKNR